MTQCRQRSFFKKSEFIFMISTLKNPTLSFSTASIWIFEFRCRWHHYDAMSSATICQRIWVHIHDQHPKKTHNSLSNRLNDSICIFLPMTSSWRNVVSKLSYLKMDLRFTLSTLENPWIQFSGISGRKKNLAPNLPCVQLFMAWPISKGIFNYFEPLIVRELKS